MFDSLNKLMEQPKVEVAMSECDCHMIQPEERERIIQKLSDDTPEALRFTTRGKRGIAHYDARGRATTSVLDDLSDAELSALRQSVEMHESDDVHEEAVVESNFKPGVFWTSIGLSSGYASWFYPMKTLANGGVSGLQVGVKRKPIKSTVTKDNMPDGRSPNYKVAEPDEYILSIFKKHDDFPASVSESLAEARRGEIGSTSGVVKKINKPSIDEYPSGRFGMVGAVDFRLAWIRQDGTELDASDADTAREISGSSNPSMMASVKKWKTRTFATRKEAEAAAKKLGIEVMPPAKKG